MKRFTLMILTLAALFANGRAQSLSVTNIEAQTGEEAALVVSLTEGTSMTALQFNLSLPEGVTLATSGDTYGATLGTATDGHTLEVETLSNGDLLFILYNTEQKAFKSGELLRIPITVGSTAIEANGKLYTVRTATADAVSHTCTDASFSVKVTEPEPAYKVGDDITSLATADWEGKTDDYGGFANPAVERYTHGTPADMDDILTQTVSGLENGTYRVQLEAAASFTPERGFDCPTGDGLSVVFANNTQRNLPVLERGWVGEGEQKLVTLTATVTDGTLKYGIKNLALSGNWFVARLKSIVYVATDAQSPKTYAISIASEKNGKTTTDVTADEEGSRVFITATPDEDCTLESLKVTTTEGKDVEVTNNSFIMPASAVTVTATYKAPEPDAVPVITADNKTRVYGDENPVLTYSADMELSGKPELSTTATKSSAVGEYDITVGKGTLTGDFTAKNGKLTITKAPLTVGVQDVTITEGDAIPTFTLTYSGWKNGDTEADAFTANPAAKTTATTSSKAGTYDITVSGGTAKNYELAYTKGTLTILKKEEPVTVTANNLTMVYGDDIPALTYKSEGAELNGTPQLSTTATKASAVGTYPIEVEAGTVTNTKATYVNGTLTITKAPLTITAKSYTIKQGEALPIFAATYSGFKNNETESVLTKKSTFACAVPLDMTPGTYDITASGAEAQNYEISYVKGTLTIEKKDEPEPITRTPFKGKISIPGILEAENFDKGGEGVTYHDNDAEDHGGTNYRSGADMGVDIVTGNGGYALGWTNGGEWIEYTMNVIEAGKYTLEAIVSNGTGDTGGFSISLVGDGGSLTKLADVNVPSTAGNWENYQPVEGELLQNLEVGSQIFRITITAGNCNIDKIKFELKKDEPEPEPEPAYKVGDDITSLATTEWEGKTGDYGGLANASVERYTHGAPADVDDILTQTVTGLRNGTYKVQLDVAASFTSDRGFTCPTGNGLSVAFANGTQRNLAVVERGWVDEGAQKIVTLTATVTDGTLKYGIKNLAPSGNWFIARLRSIVYVSESNQTPKTYAISIASEKNGTTVTDVEAEEEGSRVFITATPDEDCTLESIKVTTTGGKEVEVTNNSFIMPASAVKVSATYKEPVVDAIEDVVAEDGTYEIYTIDGKPIETLQKGVNIIRFSNGTTKSVYVK